MKTISFSLHFGGEKSLSIDQDIFVIEKNQILAIVTLIQCLKFQKICLDLLIKRSPYKTVENRSRNYSEESKKVKTSVFLEEVSWYRFP